MSKKDNGYKLSRDWFDFSFDNPEKIRPIHSAIYFFAVEHCNRLGWKEKFGFPTQMAMEAIGVKNWRTYNKALNDLVEWGFIEMVQKSKNQYSSCIICLCKKYIGTVEAGTESLDKALSKHGQKHVNSTVVIDKQTNKEQTNKEQSVYSFSEFWDDYDKKKEKKKSESKYNRLSEKDRELIKEFIPIYKAHQPNEEFRKNPTTFLNNEVWNDDWSAYPPQTKKQNNGKENRTEKYVRRVSELIGEDDF